MKYIIHTSILAAAVLLLSVYSRHNHEQPSMTTTTPAELATTPLLSKFGTYWYSGKAEISSYTLEQARYGELRKGTAVLVYVTEPFLAKEQVKAKTKHTIDVLKLNATKNFNTGIYPYSIMQSVFYPIANNQHAIKISASVQEWCGQMYSQINNRKTFELRSHSYFEGEDDLDLTLEKAPLENEIWTQLRVNPQSLPTGTISMIPSLEYARLKHIPIKAYRAKATLTEGRYHIEYPTLKRTLSIVFSPKFPYEILSWEERYKSGFDKHAKVLTTRATKLKTIRSDYWKRNSNKDLPLRTKLLLE